MPASTDIAAVSLAVALLLTAESAGAQVPWAPPYAFPVVFRANQPEAAFALSKEKDSPPFVGCNGECVVPLIEGRYFLRVEATKELLGGGRRFEVTEPSEVSIEPRTQDQRSAGYVMAGIGMGLVVLGGVGILAGGIPVDGEQRDQGDSAIFSLGLLAFVGGAVLTPLGWVKAGRSAPVLTVTPLAPR